MQIQNSKISNILVVIPMEKRIDANTAPDFKGQVVDWINTGNTRILLDLSHVEFIDSSGLGAIVSILKTLGDRGDLVICSIQKTVLGLFQLTRMNRVFQLFSTQEEALKALTG